MYPGLCPLTFDDNPAKQGFNFDFEHGNEEDSSFSKDKEDDD